MLLVGTTLVFWNTGILNLHGGVNGDELLVVHDGHGDNFVCLLHFSSFMHMSRIYLEGYSLLLFFVVVVATLRAYFGQLYDAGGPKS